MKTNGENYFSRLLAERRSRLSIEKQKELEKLFEKIKMESSREFFCLYPIQRKKQKLNIGDVFVFSPIKNIYFYGVILDNNCSNIMTKKGITVFFLKSYSYEINKDNFVADFDNPLFPPIFSNQKDWSDGYYFNIGLNIEIPADFDYGFISEKYSTKELSYLDANGNIKENKLACNSRYSLTTYYGISIKVHQEIIIDDSIDIDVDFSFFDNPRTSQNDIKLIRDKNERKIYLSMNVTDKKIMKMGEKINKINGSAYMNGYNWGILLQYYLSNVEPDIMSNLKIDPEAETLNLTISYLEGSNDNTEGFIKIIENLFNENDILFDFVLKNYTKIDWD